MPTDPIVDASIRHAIDLERYKNGVVRRIISLLNAVDDDIILQIRTAELTEFSQGRLLLLEDQIQSMIAAGSNQLQQSLETDLRELVDAELDFHEQTMVAIGAAPVSVAAGIQINRLNADDVYAAAIGQPFRGRTMGEWFKSLEDAQRIRLLEQIRIGYSEGESLDQIIKRVQGTRAAQFADGVLEISRRDAETIVRTAVQYFSNFALRKTMERAGVEYRQWVSVLDSRTTAICRGRSNKVYKMGSGPYPPAHPRCRSITVPLRSKEEVLQVPSYGDWLREQPRDVVIDILGSKKAKLFLDGNLSLDRFINRQGDELTLSELRKRYPRYWDRAGLDQAA